MKFKKKILCLLSLFLIYKVFIYNDDFFMERLNYVKDYVIEQASIMINGHGLIGEYDASDVESSFITNKDNYIKFKFRSHDYSLLSSTPFFIKFKTVRSFIKFRRLYHCIK